jgi:hypothetical protein
MRIRIIRFTKLLCYVLNDYKKFILVFDMRVLKNAEFSADSKSVEVPGKSYSSKKLFAKQPVPNNHRSGKLSLFYTFMFHNFLMSSFPRFLRRFRNQHRILSFLIPKVKFCEVKV